MFNSNSKLKGVAKKGFSIVEIMVVLVIIAALSASVLPRFIEQNKKSEAKDEFAKLTELKSRLVSLYDGELDYKGVENVWLEQLPQSFKKDKAGVVYSVWKNKITVVHSGNGFKVTYDNVPAGAACTEFAKQGRKAGWAYMEIDSKAVMAEATTAEISTACKPKTAAATIPTFAFIHQT